MLKRGILTLGAPGSESPLKALNLESPEGEIWIHLGLAALEKWTPPRDVHFERIYLDLEAFQDDLSDWTLQAWKGALNAFLIKLVNPEGKVPQLIGYLREQKWAFAVAAIKLGVRDLITWDALFADLQASLQIKNVPESARILRFPRKGRDLADHPSMPTPVLEILRKAPKNAIPFPIEGLEGNSTAIESIRNIIRKSAPMNSAVLIIGPTGSGKKRVAQTLHRYSERAHRPFVVLDCASINPSLFESELFGHVEGAFTTATQERRGVFELAHTGTLFIDQIHLLNLEQQAKLLRALENKWISRVGSDRVVDVDVRVIAASQESLEEAVRLGKFREDLYFHIKVIDIYLPSLAERRADIPILTENILKKLSKTYKKPTLNLGEASLEKMLLYDWPGNIRELQSCLERACTLAWSEGRRELRVSDLPESVQFAAMEKFKTQSLKEATRRFEKEYIAQTLRRFGGSKEETAEALGLSVATLYRKIGS